MYLCAYVPFLQGTVPESGAQLIGEVPRLQCGVCGVKLLPAVGRSLLFKISCSGQLANTALSLSSSSSNTPPMAPTAAFHTDRLVFSATNTDKTDHERIKLLLAEPSTQISGFGGPALYVAR